MNIEISIPNQTLTLREVSGELLASYAVSTALKGVGEAKGSKFGVRSCNITLFYTSDLNQLQSLAYAYRNIHP
jgi:hypothetical protein